MRSIFDGPAAPSPTPCQCVCHRSRAVMRHAKACCSTPRGSVDVSYDSGRIDELDCDHDDIMSTLGWSLGDHR